MTRYCSPEWNVSSENSLQNFCESLMYPLYYLSIKAVKAPVAKGLGIIPYQYSLHIEYSNGFVEHKEYIATETISLKEDFIKSFCQDIPMESTIITNHFSCDSNLLLQLANENYEYSYHLLSILENLRDLSKPFKENWNNLLNINDDLLFFDIESIISDSNCCNKEFEWGLEKDYVSLLEEKNSKCKELQPTLMEYSKIDTLLMVEILKKLREIQDKTE